MISKRKSQFVHIGSTSPTTSRVVESPLARVFLIVFILDMERKALGGGVLHLARLVLSRMERQRMVGTNNNDDNATIFDLYLHKETYLCTDVNNKILVVVVLSQPPFVVLRFFLAVSRPDNGNRHDRGGWYRQYLIGRTHAHFFSLRTSHVTARVAQGMMSLCESSHKSFVHRSCRC